MTIDIEQARQRILEAEREILGVAYPKTIEIVRSLFSDIKGLKGRHREWDKVKKVLVAAELLPPNTSVGTLRQYYFAVQKERRGDEAVDVVPVQAPMREVPVAVEPKAEKCSRPVRAERAADAMAPAVSAVTEIGASEPAEADQTPPDLGMAPEDLLAQAHARDAAPRAAANSPDAEEDEPEGGDATALLLRATEPSYTERGQPYDPIVNPSARVDSRIAAMTRPRSRGRAIAIS